MLPIKLKHHRNADRQSTIKISVFAFVIFLLILAHHAQV